MTDIPFFSYDPENPKNSVLENEDAIHRRTVEMVDIGYNNGMDVVTLFQLLTTSDEKDKFLNLHWYNWVNNLEVALEYFESIEDYEMCSYTKDVLERITE